MATPEEVDMSDCPRCCRPLTEDGDLRYCDLCAYEPPESARLPASPPHEYSDEAQSSSRPGELNPPATDRQVA